MKSLHFKHLIFGLGLSLFTISCTLDNEKSSDDSIEVVNTATIPSPVPSPPPPPPPPPPPSPDWFDSDVYKVVDQMPRFPGCEQTGSTNEERESCAKEKMLSHIYQKLKYPKTASSSGIEGMTVIQFIVSEDGTIEESKIIKDIGGGCGEAAKAAVDSMNDLAKKWIPGSQNGKTVKVLYTLPIKFKLE